MPVFKRLQTVQMNKFHGDFTYFRNSVWADPQGTLIVAKTGSFKSGFGVWDLSTKEMLWGFSGHEIVGYSGRLLAVSRELSVDFIDLDRKGEVIRSIPVLDSFPELVISNDQLFLACCTVGGTGASCDWRIYSLEDGQFVSETHQIGSAGVFSSDNRQLMIADDSTGFVAYNFGSGESAVESYTISALIQTDPGDQALGRRIDRLKSIAIVHDGHVLALSGSNSVWLYDLKEKEIVLKISDLLENKESPKDLIGFTANNRYLFCIADKSVIAIDISDGKETACFNCSASIASCTLTSSDSIAVVDKDGTASILALFE